MSALQSLQYDPSTSPPSLLVLDQLLLPQTTAYLPITSCADAHAAISQMNVRGAPLIALVALLGLSVDLHTVPSPTLAHALAQIAYLKTSRPTAVNLFNALDELTSKLLPDCDVVAITTALATSYLKEDLETNRALSQYGAEAIAAHYPAALQDTGFNLITICNTGSLATAGHGTALGIVRTLHAASQLASLGILETRPYNQGARLTCYEALTEAFPNPTLLVDAAAPSYLNSMTVHAAVVGADRVTANGDTANKIGTLALALHCKANNVPFFVACPTTTLDPERSTGANITIEYRPDAELIAASNAPKNMPTYNPAFDVTPSSLIAGIITEHGVIYPNASGSYDIPNFLTTHQSPARPLPPDALLTVETASAYVTTKLASLTTVLPPSSDTDTLLCSEVEGGNLNYAFSVSYVNVPTASVFVKQAPDFVKCLGPDAKMHKERMELEVLAYETWLRVAPEVGKYLPAIYDFDKARETVIMEFLGTCEMLEQRLVGDPTFEPAIANGLGEFMAITHVSTHVTQVPFGVAAGWMVGFGNEALRGLQLEYVFTKAFEGGKFDTAFMEGVEEMKMKYRGEDAGNLALCHGDLHPGSVMIDNDRGVVKIIDPEFAVYGPPGLDLGSLLSGVVLAAVHHSVGGGEVKGVKVFARNFVNCYRMRAEELGESVVEGIFCDAVGFAACEVARTALGFAGGRKWLQFDDEKLKQQGLEKAVEVAKKLMLGRKGGASVLLDALGEL